MRRALLAFVVALVALGTGSIWMVPANAAPGDASVTIEPGATLNPPSVHITEGHTVTWTNLDSKPHDIYAESNKVTTTPIPIGGSYTSPGFAAGTYDYGLTPSSHDGTITVDPAPTTTTTTTSTTSTSTTTTTLRPTTTTTTKPSTTTSSSTTTTSTTTTTAVATVPVNDRSGGSNSGTALLLGIAAVVVAGLATAAYWAWWRSGDDLPYDDGPPPTTTQPPV